MAGVQNRKFATSVEERNRRGLPSAVLPQWRLARRLRETYRVFTNRLQERLDPHGMRVSDWAHLREISDREGITQVELSRQLRIEKASSTAVLKKLHEAGLTRTERKTEDQRKIGIHLTTKGVKVLQDVLPEVLGVIEQARQGIPDEEIEHFVRTLDRIMANLSETAKECSKA